MKDEKGLITIEVCTSMLLYFIAIFLIMTILTLVTSDAMIHRSITNLALEVSEMGYVSDEITSGETKTMNYLVGGSFGYRFSMDESPQKVYKALKTGKGINTTFFNDIEYNQFEDKLIGLDISLYMMGIDYGLEGVDFSGSHLSADGSEVYINAKYSYMIMELPMFDIKCEIPGEQSVKTGVWR